MDEIDVTDLPEQRGEKKSRFWINAPPILFDTFIDLLRAQAEADTRAIYVITFVDALDLLLPQGIEEYEEYKKLIKERPLTEGDPLEKLPFELFRKWIEALKRIMRTAEIIGGEKIIKANEESEIAMLFDELGVDVP